MDSITKVALVKASLAGLHKWLPHYTPSTRLLKAGTGETYAET